MKSYISAILVRMVMFTHRAASPVRTFNNDVLAVALFLRHVPLLKELNPLRVHVFVDAG